MKGGVKEQGTYHGQVSGRIPSQRAQAIDKGFAIAQHLGWTLGTGHAQAVAVTTEGGGGGGKGGGGKGGRGG